MHVITIKLASKPILHDTIKYFKIIFLLDLLRLFPTKFIFLENLIVSCSNKTRKQLKNTLKQQQQKINNDYNNNYNRKSKQQQQQQQQQQQD
jgi:hypothetical protein